MPDRLLLGHRGAEIAAGIAVAAPVGDRIAEDLAAIILDPVRGLEGPARLDRAEDVEHLARGDLGDVLVADRGKHVALTAGYDTRGIFVDPRGATRLKPPARELLETPDSGNHHDHHP